MQGWDKRESSLKSLNFSKWRLLQGFLHGWLLPRTNRKEQVRDASGSVLWTSVKAWTPMSATKKHRAYAGNLHTHIFPPAGWLWWRQTYFPPKKEIKDILIIHYNIFNKIRCFIFFLGTGNKSVCTIISCWSSVLLPPPAQAPDDANQTRHPKVCLLQSFLPTASSPANAVKWNWNFYVDFAACCNLEKWLPFIRSYFSHL